MQCVNDMRLLGCLKLHADWFRHQLEAHGSSCLRSQILCHERDVAEMLAGHRVFLFNPADERCLVCLDTNAEEEVLRINLNASVQSN